jgi:nucleotidyltransferase substrate binding protein (TIGR01987 family)
VDTKTSSASSITYKHERLTLALTTLENAIASFDKIGALENHPSFAGIDYVELYRMSRDSMIQRFEFSVDLFWKYLKKYLDEMGKIVDVNAPVPVTKFACNAKIVNEQEAERIIAMINARNITSHKYREEVAEDLSANIPRFHKLMDNIAQRLEV